MPTRGSPSEPAAQPLTGLSSAEARLARLLAPLRFSSGDSPALQPILVLGSAAALSPANAGEPAVEERIHAVSTATRAEEALDTLDPALLVLDLSFAEQCETLLRSVLARPRFALLPVLAIRASDSQVPDAHWHALGIEELLRRDGVGFGVALRTRLRRATYLSRCVRRDPLTQLANAASFCERLESAASLAARDREALSLALVDVDGVARLNAQLGRAGADDVLCRFAASLAGCFRRSDLVARWQGDSFAVLLPHTGRGGAVKAMQKARYVLRNTNFLPEGSLLPMLTASVAVVQHPAPASTGETLAIAARLLSRAKEEGGDRILAEDEDRRQVAARRILLADDDEVTASVIRHRLGRAGYDVLHLRDGATALRLAPDADASLAILNIKTPELDGFEVLRRLRSIRSLRGLPIIMLASMGRDTDIVRGFQLGADDYLIKPFSPAELVARVQRLLERA